MLRPKDMVRVLLVGPADLLSPTVDVLHELRVLHIVDFQDEDDTFHLGSPLEKGPQVSETLLKLRSLANVLDLEGRGGFRPETIGRDAAQKLATLELNIREEEETRQALEKGLTDVSLRIEAIRPFAALRLELGQYREYEALEVFVGRMSRDPVGLAEVTDQAEVVRAGEAIALFVPQDHAEAVRDLLARQGYVPLEVPVSAGDPEAILRDLEHEQRNLEGKLASVRDRLLRLRERFGGFVTSAEAYFTTEAEKAEAPLRFARTEHSFVAEGWIPADRWSEVEARLAGIGTLYVARLDDVEEDPPVLLDNPRPVRPFEMLTNLFSTPNYREIDPTVTLFLVFPLFFGMMVGDLGYGTVIALVGLLGLRTARSASPDIRRFLAILLVTGLVTALFGALLYADAFGIPFHAPPEAHEELVLNWSDILGVTIPLQPVFNKLTDFVDLLVLSILAGFLHLAVGYTFGIVNEARHSRRHALAKGAWLMVLLGLFITIMQRVAANRVAAALWDTLLVWVPRQGLVVFGFEIPWVAFGLLLGGALLVAALEIRENPVAAIEVAGLLANLVSYTRLAGIAVADAAIAENLNHTIVSGLVLTPNLALVVLGIVLLPLAHLLILGLGGLSAGIQSLRLNYVEFFMKFFKGDGVPFTPFGVPKSKSV